MKSFNQFLDEAKKKKCPEGKVRNDDGKCVKKTNTTKIFVIGGRRFGSGGYHDKDHDNGHTDQGDRDNIISDGGDGGGGE